MTTRRPASRCVSSIPTIRRRRSSEYLDMNADSNDDFEVWRDHDVTVWCGVQIHGHGGDDWVWPRDAWYTGADGERRRFPPAGD